VDAGARPGCDLSVCLSVCLCRRCVDRSRVPKKIKTATEAKVEAGKLLALMRRGVSEAMGRKSEAFALRGSDITETDKIHFVLLGMRNWTI
jgi:hypothetical protein